MDLKTIKTFKAIVKYGSFQRAAEELNYAQSTVTTHVKNLEADLGVTLIERGKHLKLTDAGRLLIEKGEILLKGFESLESSMEELIKGEAGVIRMGVMEPTASFRLPDILKNLKSKFPKVHVSIQIHSVIVLNEMHAKEEIDFALCTAPEKQEGVVFVPLFSEEVGLLLPIHHPLNQKDEIFLKDLENEQILMTSSFCPFRRNLEKQMIKEGVNPQYGIEVSNLMALKHYVAKGFGIAVVPFITVCPPPQGTIIRSIQDFKNGLTVGIMRKDEHFYKSQALEYFIQILQEGLKMKLIRAVY